MPRAYPLELRLRVVAAVEEDGDTYEQAADRFKIGVATVDRWLALARKGELAPKPMRNGHRPVICGPLAEELRQLVVERPEDTTFELRDRFEERTGISVSRATIGRAVNRLGFTRKKRPSKPKNGSRSE